MISKHSLIYGNANNLDFMGKSVVDLIITSPPYPMIQMWDEMFMEQNSEVLNSFNNNDRFGMFEEMNKVLDLVWEELHQIMKPGGICCINIGDATRTINNDFALYVSHSRITNFMNKIGFVSLPGILWHKQTNAPNKYMGSGMLPVGAYMTLEHEHILLFRKGFKKREFKTLKEKTNRRESAFFWEERNLWFSDIWTDIKGINQKIDDKKLRGRSAAFPIELPYRLVNMFSVKGDLVFDPFLGTGTTTVASIMSCRNSLGVEIVPEFNKVVSDKLNSLVKFSNNYIDNRLNAHKEFVKQRLSTGKNFKYKNKKYNFPVVSKQEEDLYINKLESITINNDEIVVIYT